MRIRMSILAGSVFSCSLTAGHAHAVATLGARLGVSVAKASLDAGQTFDSANRTGFAATVFLDAGMGLLSLQPEVSYIEKGVKDEATGNVIELNYVELAALFKAGLPLAVVQPHVFAGIAADFSTKDSTRFGDVDISTKNADWTVPIGVDVRIAFGTLALYGDARYAIGLTDISEGAENLRDLKNRAWILSAGLGKSF